jgi:hypothetical protein
LFLAFPAIFCASATLIEKHERERKERAGVRGTRRGKEAAALDAAGAALGSFGLLAFGAAIWLLAHNLSWWARGLGGLVCRLCSLVVYPTMDMGRFSCAP